MTPEQEEEARRSYRESLERWVESHLGRIRRQEAERARRELLTDPAGSGIHKP